MDRSTIVVAPLENTKRFYKFKNEIRKNKFVYIIIIPVILHYAIFALFPMLFSFILSFFNWRLSGNPVFVGLENWKEVFLDKQVWNSIIVTAKFTLYYVLPVNLIGIILGILVTNKIKYTSLFKSIFFLPVVTSGIIIAGIWKWIFMGESRGIANSLLSIIGVEPISFFSNGEWAIIVLALLSIYRISGNLMIYYVAGLNGIPDDVYQAASIDGANKLQTVIKITLPLLKPIFLYCLMITTIGSFQVFDSAYVLTSGGPNYSTDTIVYHLYNTAFINLRLGYASCIAYILFIIIGIITIIQYKVLNSDVSYT